MLRYLEGRTETAVGSARRIEIHRSLGESHQLNVAKLRRVVTFWCGCGAEGEERIDFGVLNF